MFSELDNLGLNKLNHQHGGTLYRTAVSNQSDDTARQSSGAVCESRGGRPGLHAPNKSGGFCGRKATLNIGTQNSGAV